MMDQSVADKSALVGESFLDYSMWSKYLKDEEGNVAQRGSLMNTVKVRRVNDTA